MANIHCKFYVGSKMTIAASQGKLACWQINLSPIWESPATDAADRGNACRENRVFGKNTPNGSIQLTITNPLAAEAFEVGREYYVDFTPAHPDKAVKYPE